ncbi:hypothetical protein FDECE_7966 [Fusarium decemcellulare]|nr:hypothetical protein FDECE_7966 [Fusarium decemcellulare]
MSTKQLSPNFIEVVAAENVLAADKDLTWTRDGASEQVSRDELVFVFHGSKRDPSSDFWLCFVKEEPENHERPFRLLVVRTPRMPSDLLDHMITELPPYLKHGFTSDFGITNEVDVIVSTKSGVGLAPRVWEEVVQPLWNLLANDEIDLEQTGTKGLKLDSNKPYYRVTLTESAETVRDFARNLWAQDAGQSKARTIVLLSGDGGVVDMLNGSDGDEPPKIPPSIALLPLGTANALFHSIHKPLYSDPGPTPLARGLRTLFWGTPCDLPVFRASFSPGSRIVTFSDNSKTASPIVDATQIQKQEISISHLQGAIVASYGFHANIVYESDTPEYRIHGNKRFRMVAQELLRESHAYAAKVSIRRRGSTTFEDIPREKHAYVLTALVSNLERTFTISPATLPLQSQLRLVHFGPVGGERTMDVMMKAYDEGSHVNIEWPDGEKVGYDEVDEVKIVILEDDERWRKVCIDGTIVEIPKGGEMSIKNLDHSIVRVVADPRVVEGVTHRS